MAQLGALGAPTTDHAERLERIDARLKALLPALDALAVERRLVADELLDDEMRAAHWWWSLPSSEPDEDLGPAGPLHDWLARRIQHGPDGDRLVLERDEARALLDSPRGRELAAELDELIDLSAAEPTAEELRTRYGNATIGELAPPPDWAIAQYHRGTDEDPPAYGPGAEDTAPGMGVVVPLRRPLPPYKERRLAAATSDGRTDAEGRLAIVHFNCAQARVVPRVGLVAWGRTLDETRAAWLVVPRRDVTQLGLGDDPLLPRDRWAGGGLLVACDQSDAPLSLSLRRSIESGEERDAVSFEAPREQVSVESALREVLASLAYDDLEKAREQLAACLRRLPETERQALDGLQEAIEQWEN
jgi:hypothetical protein